MNYGRFGNPPDIAVLVSLVALCAAILVFVWLMRRREKLGDWGPGTLHPPVSGLGHSSADLRGTDVAPDTGDAEDRMMRALAAPFVEQAGLMHERWSLVPAFCDAAWRRHAMEIIDRWQVRRSSQWKRQADSAETELVALINEENIDPVMMDDLRAARVLAIARFTMLLRLGVCARHVSGARARRRLRPYAVSVHAETPDWLTYGDAFMREYAARFGHRASEMRADIRVLHQPGGPWHDSRL